MNASATIFLRIIHIFKIQIKDRKYNSIYYRLLFQATLTCSHFVLHMRGGWRWQRRWQRGRTGHHIQAGGWQLARAGRDDSVLGARWRAARGGLQCIEAVSLHAAAKYADADAAAAAYGVVIKHAHAHTHTDAHASARIMWETQTIASCTAILHGGQRVQRIAQPLAGVDVAIWMKHIVHIALRSYMEFSPEGAAGTKETAAILQRRLGLLHALLQLLERRLMEAIWGPVRRALAQGQAILRLHLGERRRWHALQVQRRLIRTRILVHGATFRSVNGYLLVNQWIPLDSIIYRNWDTKWDLSLCTFIYA